MPGIIATLLIKNLTVAKGWDSFKFSIYTILFSGITYLLLQFVINLILWIISNFRDNEFYISTLKIWDNLTEESTIPYLEVVYACLLSIIVGLFVSFLIRKKVLYIVAKYLRVSYKFGDENLFYHFMRSDRTSAIYLKDIENNLIYHGFIDYYSESDVIREILLKDVDVYSYIDSKWYYKVPCVYLSQSINKNWLIELPNINTESDELNKNGKETTPSKSIS